MPRTLWLICTLLLLSAAAPHATRAPSDQPRELVVALQPGVILSQGARAIGAGAAPLDTLLRGTADAALPLDRARTTYRLQLRPGVDPDAAAERLMRLALVRYAEPNHHRSAALIPSDPLFPRQPALAAIRAPGAWDTTTGQAIVIAIVDTGISPTHLDLKTKLLPGVDLINRDDDPRDDDGHGTYTAGIAAASSDNRVGVAGVCWGCPIMPVKVLNRRGQGNDATITEGIRWAVDSGARIISLSLGGGSDTSVLREAIQYAHDQGALVVASSGNIGERGNQPSYPAAYPSVLAVGATTAADTIASFSTRGEFVDLTAPGEGVLSTSWNVLENDTYTTASGTSSAAPHVAGAAALVWSARPELTPDQVADVLGLAADDAGAPGRDAEYGYGRLNVARALEVARDPALLSRSRIEGFVRAAAPAELLVTLSTGQTTRPDARGFFRFEGLAPGAYTVAVSGGGLDLPPQSVALTGTALSAAQLEFRQAPQIAPAFAPVPAPPVASDIRYFSETGHTLRGAFRRYWEAQGGLIIFGYPISEELREPSDDGRERVVQYFERHRLELHPELPAPYQIQLTRLGDLVLQAQGRSWFSFPRGQPRAGCELFEATGHTLCEPFLSYWRSNGLELDGRSSTTSAESLALFGQPLSEPHPEMTSGGQAVVVQWFERARFEDHGDGRVLLGLLGNELVSARGWR